MLYVAPLASTMEDWSIPGQVVAVAVGKAEVVELATVEVDDDDDEVTAEEEVEEVLEVDTVLEEVEPTLEVDEVLDVVATLDEELLELEVISLAPQMPALLTAAPSTLFS